MKNSRTLSLIMAAFVMIAMTFSANAAQVESEKAPAGMPCFSLRWSEYPSWSVFGVADSFRLIDGRKGWISTIEKKWGVDIELKEAEYDPCLQMYGSGQCDAVCITNMDVLNPSLTRKSVVIMPSSTSYGADGCIVVKNEIGDITALRGVPVYGLEKTVSQYAFVRNLELLGEKEADHKFTNMDPGAAALAMQQKQKNFNAIMVWNPFVLETLNKRPDTKVLFDSRTIPGEIIDTISMAQDSLDKPGGEAFACAVIDTFYAVCKRLADPKTSDDTTVAIGEKFSHLNLASMKKVLQQTRFYDTPDMALEMMTGGKLFPGGKVQTDGNLPEIMERVVKFCVGHDITSKEPVVGYGNKAQAGKSDLRWDTTYIRQVVAKNKK